MLLGPYDVYVLTPGNVTEIDQIFCGGFSDNTYNAETFLYKPWRSKGFFNLMKWLTFLARGPYLYVRTWRLYTLDYDV